ncbi:hypothetical protein AB1Y20_000432 [Prymnesium parvum]|uniref:Uncharacterized protein n=1 Tax=Prymnesium parvum TaxID=97485 RepID=A0AB34K9D8_PRYPA
MRVIGLSWSEWKTPWSSSSNDEVGTVPQLRAHLLDVLQREKELSVRDELPSKHSASLSSADLAAECPAPQLRRKTFKALGQPTAQADALSSDHTRMSPEELLAAAEKRRKELERAGEIDWVSDRQPYPTGQGPVPDSKLIGKALEVRWRYYSTETKQPVYIWCEGEVVQAWLHLASACAE